MCSARHRAIKDLVPGDGVPFMPAILARLAPKLGARVILEPEFQVVGCIEFPNGRRSYFWHNKFNLNSVSAARIAQDKGYTHHFLERLGFGVPRTQTFFREDFRQHLRSARGIQAAIRFAEETGWPVYVKPCRRSQGDGIELATSARELKAAMLRIFARDRTLLVQAACRGRDYRLVVLDGEVISAYERVPLAVIGDGESTVLSLLKKMQQAFERDGRDTKLDLEDRRIAATLRRLGLRLASVLPRGRKVRLLEVANLSCGGTTVEITDRVHPSVAQLAANIATAMDLRLAGVDIMCRDATRPVKKYHVLEVNSAPGLDHYGSFGPEHEAHVDALYLKVLQAVGRGGPA